MINNRPGVGCIYRTMTRPRTARGHGSYAVWALQALYWSMEQGAVYSALPELKRKRKKKTKERKEKKKPIPAADNGNKKKVLFY